jgi:hypothetical protein
MAHARGGDADEHFVRTSADRARRYRPRRPCLGDGECSARASADPVLLQRTKPGTTPSPVRAVRSSCRHRSRSSSEAASLGARRPCRRVVWNLEERRFENAVRRRFASKPYPLTTWAPRRAPPLPRALPSGARSTPPLRRSTCTTSSRPGTGRACFRTHHLPAAMRRLVLRQARYASRSRSAEPSSRRRRDAELPRELGTSRATTGS